MDTNAVQRHRNIILDCLRDGDISIRRRALELSYALINEQNVRVLIRELLAFLEVADTEFKLGMTTQISLAAERFAPNKRWHIDTFLRVLKLVGIYLMLITIYTEHSTGRKLCSRRNPFGVHPASRTYTWTTGIHCIKAISGASVWYLSRITDSCCSVGDRWIQWNTSWGWYHRRRTTPTGRFHFWSS